MASLEPLEDLMLSDMFLDFDPGEQHHAYLAHEAVLREIPFYLLGSTLQQRD